MRKQPSNTMPHSNGNWSGPDTALRFDVEVERALACIIQAPRRWAVGPYSTRRFLLRRFPFILIYRELTPGEIQIVAVAHTARKPGYWKRRT